ncbi:hypothetical protein EVAR_37427_1 [Eumeta japonica]|uniref:Uncharacterized protein n=1 Tax=Eumeta variegata TaxID=151549 RepID=A0A4C1WHR1_EUMVA|nr:hypothetical protein EVAR_37427_1 [Eumeta japonica]
MKSNARQEVHECRSAKSETIYNVITSRDVNDGRRRLAPTPAGQFVKIGCSRQSSVRTCGAREPTPYSRTSALKVQPPLVMTTLGHLQLQTSHKYVTDFLDGKNISEGVGMKREWGDGRRRGPP